MVEWDGKGEQICATLEGGAQGDQKMCETPGDLATHAGLVEATKRQLFEIVLAMENAGSKEGRTVVYNRADELGWDAEAVRRMAMQRPIEHGSEDLLLSLYETEKRRKL